MVNPEERKLMRTMILLLPSTIHVLLACAHGEPTARKGAEELLKLIGFWDARTNGEEAVN